MDLLFHSVFSLLIFSSFFLVLIVSFMMGNIKVISIVMVFCASLSIAEITKAEIDQAVTKGRETMERLIIQKV